MSGIVTEAARAEAQLEYLPVGLFGSVMGLTGLSVAWDLALARYGGLAWAGMLPRAIGIIAVILFVAILAGYLVKIVTAFHAVRAEFNHPTAGNLFGTFLISLLLLPIVLVPYSLFVARIFWIAGAGIGVAVAVVLGAACGGTGYWFRGEVWD